MNTFTTSDCYAAEAPASQCPRCGKSFDVDLSDDDLWDDSTSDSEAAAERAAHCCLFLEFDHAARRRIGRRVARGDTWLDAIAAERQGAKHA